MGQNARSTLTLEIGRVSASIKESLTSTSLRGSDSMSTLELRLEAIGVSMCMRAVMSPRADLAYLR